MKPDHPFQPYGTAHLIVIFLTIALPFFFAALVRWTKSPITERIIVGALSLILVLNYFVYLSLVGQFGALSWKQMLPMQLCDWAMVVIIIAMWTRRPLWFEVAYFWGIGGTVQAVLTPNLAYGFPDFRFFSFFISHCGVIIGIVIGGGIFVLPNVVARNAPSHAAIVSVWIIGGVLSFCGALAYAELGAMLPATGGQYVYLREAFGPVVAFLTGWTSFVAGFSGAIAANT